MGGFAAGGEKGAEDREEGGERAEWVEFKDGGLLLLLLFLGGMYKDVLDTALFAS